MKYPQARLVFNRKKTASKSSTAMVEVYVGGKEHLYVSTGVNVSEPQWNAATMQVVRRPDAATLNAIIDDTLRRVRTHIARLWDADNYSAANLRVAIEGTGSSENPIDWFEAHMLRDDLSEGSRRQRMTFIRKWRTLPYFQSWKGFTLANLRKYDAFARSLTSKPSALYNYHKHLRCCLAEAVRWGMLQKSPYDEFHVPSPRQDTTAIRYLTAEERDRIAALPLSGTMAVVRDAFILCCYTGLAYSDMKKIVPGDITRDGERMFLRDKRVKTGTAYKLTLLPPAVEILERYGWSMPVPSLVVYNGYLTVIGEAAGVTTHLSSHVARHTFATWALSSGVKIETVSKMLAHTNVTTTQIYAKVLQQDVDAGFDLLADK